MRFFILILSVLLSGSATTWAQKTLSFYHTHTKEKFSGVYHDGKSHQLNTLKKINLFLRDHRTGSIQTIDVKLLDILWDIAKILNPEHPEKICFDVISGYRSPKTNEMLRTTKGGVSKKSLHMEGKAIDIRVKNVSLSLLRDSAKSLKRGGVGCYPNEKFVHVDTGRVRYWGFME